MKRSRFVGLALAIATVVAAVVAVERGADDNKARFGKVLGRTNPVDSLLEPKVTS